MGRALNRYDLPPQTHNLNLIMRKIIRQVPKVGQPALYLASVSQNYQGHQRQGKSEELS